MSIKDEEVEELENDEELEDDEYDDDEDDEDDDLIDFDAIVPRKAWRPKLEPGDDDKPVTKYGGLPWMEADDSWPVCDCGRRFAFIFQIRLDDLPDAPYFGRGLVQLFLCEGETCGPECYHLRYIELERPAESIDAPPERPENGYELSPPEPMRVVGWAGPGNDYPAFGDMDFEALMATQPKVRKEDIKHYLSGLSAEDDDKLGGWPFWHEELSGELPHCDVCGGRTRLLYQLDFRGSRVLPEFSGIAFLSQCPKHKDELNINWTT